MSNHEHPCRGCGEDLRRLGEHEANCLALKLSRIRELVNLQAEDAGLWFVAATAPEAYLQQELRKLHALIEEAPK